MKHLAALALLAALPLFAACQRDAAAPDAPADAATAPETALGRTVARAMEEARRELREGNLSLNDSYGIRVGGKRIQRKAGDLPAAEITPDGELIVAGSPIDMDARSRALAREYREGLISVAEAGMDLGVQGADLGMKAAGDAIASIFRGDSDQVEKRIEAEAGKLEASARRLCDRLPRLLQAQDALAAAVPAFEPYARMDAGDIEDCGKDGWSGDGEGDGDGGDAATAADAAARADAAAEATR